MDQRIGLLLAGGIEIVELIGEGGMGCVYRAVQPPLNREVCVKFISPAPRNVCELRANFWL